MPWNSRLVAVIMLIKAALALLVCGCSSQESGQPQSTEPSGFQYHAVMRISNALTGTRLHGIEGCTVLANGGRLCESSSENGYITFVHYFNPGSEPTTTPATAIGTGFETWSGDISWAPGSPATAITNVRMVPIGTTPPSLMYTPEEFAFRGGDGPAVLSIWNGGDGSLDWEIDLLTTFWINASPREGASTGEKDDISITVDWDKFWPGQDERSTTLTIITRLGNAEIPITARATEEEPQIVAGTTNASGEFTYFSRHENTDIVIQVLNESGAPLSGIRIDAFHTNETFLVIARDGQDLYYPNMVIRPTGSKRDSMGGISTDLTVEPVTIILGGIVLANTIHWLITDPPHIELLAMDAGVSAVCVTGDLEDVANTLSLVSFGAGTFLHIGSTVASKLGLSSTFAQMVDAAALEWIRALLDIGFVMDADYTICQAYVTGVPLPYIWIPEAEMQSTELPEILSIDTIILSSEALADNYYRVDFDVTVQVSRSEAVHRMWLFTNGSGGSGDMSGLGSGVFTKSVRGATVIKDGLGSNEEGMVQIYILLNDEEVMVDEATFDLF